MSSERPEDERIDEETVAPEPVASEPEAPEPEAPEPAAETPAEPAPRSGAIRRPTRAQVGVGARVLLGAATAVGAVVAVTAAAAVPWPDVQTPPIALEVQPAPGETVLACDGPLLALGRDPQNAQQLTVAEQSDITSGNDRGDELSSDALAQPAVEGEAAASRLRQLPDGTEAVSAAASSSVSVSDDDIAGFAASACRPPQMESWIVGGDTETGSTGILLVANPGDVDATVQITVYGVNGATTPPGAEAVPIPPRTQVALPIAGLAGGEQSPVLRITATGSPVRASLQSSLVRTLDPAGIDVQSSVRPAALQVVPGVRVVGAAGSADSSTTIARMLAQQDADVTVTVTESGPDGGVVGDPDRVELQAGSPLEVDLGALPEGEYTVTVDSSAPVVAAVWQTTGFGAGSDYAWHTAAPDVAQPTLFAVPDGPQAALSVVNTGSDEATVTLTEQGGDSEDVEIAAGESVSVPVTAGRLYTIDPGGATVRASVGFASREAIGSFALWADAARPAPVVVYP